MYSVVTRKAADKLSRSIAKDYIAAEDKDSSRLIRAQGKEKAIDYLVCKIGKKLSVSAREKGYIQRTTVKVPMDRDIFEDLFSGLSHGRRRFDVTAEELNILLPDGWSERAFQTSTKCVVCWEQHIKIRFANQRKLNYDHSDSPHFQWSKHQTGSKPRSGTLVP
ncbi:hypothetical protein ACROYT_G015189 [Oculina patagonica]